MSLAKKYFLLALDAADIIKDIPSTIMINFYLGSYFLFICDFNNSIQSLILSLEGVSAFKRNILVISIKAVMVMDYCFLGNIKKGYEISKDIMQEMIKVNDIQSKFTSYSYHGIACYYKGFYEQSITNFENSRILGEDYYFYGPMAVSNFYLGEIKYELKQYKESDKYYNTAITILNKSHILPSLIKLLVISKTRACIRINENIIDLNELFQLESENKLPLFQGWMRHHIAEILLHIDDNHLIEAEEWILKAIDADSKNGMMLHLSRDWFLYHEILKKKGDLVAAKEYLAKSLAQSKECGADGDVKKCEEAMKGFTE